MSTYIKDSYFTDSKMQVDFSKPEAVENVKKSILSFSRELRGSESVMKSNNTFIPMILGSCSNTLFFLLFSVSEFTNHAKPFKGTEEHTKYIKRPIDLVKSIIRLADAEARGREGHEWVKKWGIARGDLYRKYRGLMFQ